MGTNLKQRKAAKEFAERWKGRGYEKREAQSFWLDLLLSVFEIQNPTLIIDPEFPVKIITQEKGHDSIDFYIPTTKVLIEQKSSHIDLTAKAKQSDGQMLTPYQQARRYAAGLPASQTPQWIVVCNFTTFEVHDMERPNDPPEIICLADLEKEYHRLQFLVDNTATNVKKELEVSVQAGEIVGELYDKILREYKNPDNPESQKSLNKLCVRLVFCLYAEDAGIFGKKNMFHDYMAQFSEVDFHDKLSQLFQVLDTNEEDRGKLYLNKALAEFPYVNGGLFSGNIEIPCLSDEIRTLILQRASDDFDWSGISPTIFGAVFESTLNPETRRKGGMHYTSIESIHKVIAPLFLDDLKAELKAIQSLSAVKTKIEKARAFQKKLASLKFFDPACGSGNFLTESYTELRRLENEVIRIMYGANNSTPVLGLDAIIEVSINQFYGIEINDFACSVAQTALWIAELQMLQETAAIVSLDLNPLPLKTYTNICEGNALRMDWHEVVPVADLNYIIGNPPFVGSRIMSAEQKEDLLAVFGKKWEKAGEMDYVTGWFKKSQELMLENPNIHAALVSTNSITQGEQVAAFWKPLMESGVHIDFAWRTFVWNSEASQKARVHCVIIGFSMGTSENKRKIYEGDSVREVANINGYLFDGENIFVEGRTKALCDVPEIGIGNKPIDGGFYLFKDEEKEEFVKKEPASEKYFKCWYGSDEFINRRPRWCLWLGDVNPMELLKLPECMKRVNAVREFRLASKSAGTVKLADHPTRFHVENMPKGNYLLIPETSSEKRDYIPIGFMGAEVLCSNLVKLVPDATLYHFGVLTSSVHNAWMRIVGGRLESRYRYSKEIVYNNFPWPTVTSKQKEKIEQTAQAILDAREKYSDATLADLYGSMYLFPELLKAHQANDAAVMEAYGFAKNLDEMQLVTRLLRQYKGLVEGRN
ncbi:class I SAM-dependent DNA methyltransferase [bacterium]|nr:class I SAM-dependent DNA methyltransferase [bacterium]